MDRRAQEPPDRTDPPNADSPLSFPVEASPPPDAGTPVESFRAEASRRGNGGSDDLPLSFPVEVPRPPDGAAPEASGGGDGGPGESPLSFPVEAPRPEQPPQPAEPLPFPVAQLPGTAEPSAHPAGPPQQAAWPSHPAAGGPQQAQQPTGPPQQAVWPSQPPAGAPHPADRPSGALRVLPAALSGLGALMAAVGSFLPLFVLQQHIGAGGFLQGADVTVVQTAWGTSYQLPGQETVETSGSPLGIPLLAAVAILAVAAFVVAARPGRLLSRSLLVAGAAFTTGAVATVAMNGFGWPAARAEIELEVAVASGMWLLIVAALAATAAAVVAHLVVRNADEPAGWADPAVAYADTPTPPSGVAITVLPPDDEHP